MLALQLEVILCLKNSVSVHLKSIVRRVENNKVTTRKYKKGPNKPEKIAKNRKILNAEGLLSGIFIETISFSALTQLKEAVTLQREVLDTPEEQIITHQALASVFRGLGRDEDAEKEMEKAAKCAKSLGPLEVDLEVNLDHGRRWSGDCFSFPSCRTGISNKESTVCIVS